MAEGMLALSIRQPWAWLIIHGKDIENRTWKTSIRGKVLIHAAKGMTRQEYWECALFCGQLPDWIMTKELPSFEQLKAQCGGIVGEMNIIDCVTKSDSPWFCGPFGFVIGSAASLPFRPCAGTLGFFKVETT